MYFRKETDLITGQLTPSDGVKGCTFMILEIKEKAAYRVSIYSPYDIGECVDSALLPPEEVFPWLLERQDY